MATLEYLATTVDLPDDLFWADEYAWSAVESERTYSVLGAVLLRAGQRLAGRSITLSAADRYGWMTRTVLNTLYAWSNVPRPTMTLVFRGVTYIVTWNPDQNPIEATPLIDYEAPIGDDLYIVTLRFITRE